jgi:hypothetical protein
LTADRRWRLDHAAPGGAEGSGDMRVLPALEIGFVIAVSDCLRSLRRGDAAVVVAVSRLLSRSRIVCSPSRWCWLALHVRLTAATVTTTVAAAIPPTHLFEPGSLGLSDVFPIEDVKRC